MIRFQELVPDYYIEKSRDFQVLCRLYDFTLNAVKYNIDSMSTMTDTRMAKDTILPLIGDKFGIYDKDAYSNRYLLEALPIAIKYKGSLKAVNILINAFLDSQEIFDYVTAFLSKDEESAKEISEILRRDVKPYTIVIFISDYPDMTSLHILNEYLKMVIPSGMIVEYMFGLNKVIFEKFRYKEYVFLYFTNLSDDSKYVYTVVTNPSGNPLMNNYYEKVNGEITLSRDTEVNNEKTYYVVSRKTDSGIKIQDVSLVKNKDIKYSGKTPEQYEDNEFVKHILDDVDINSVALASVSGPPKTEIITPSIVDTARADMTELEE